MFSAQWYLSQKNGCLDYTGVCKQRWVLITLVFSADKLFVQTSRLESQRGIDHPGLKWSIATVPVSS